MSYLEDFTAKSDDCMKTTSQARSAYPGLTKGYFI